MPSFFDMFRRGSRQSNSAQEEMVRDLDKVTESATPNAPVMETFEVSEDNSDNGLLSGPVESITESVVHHSITSLTDMLADNNYQSSQLINELHTQFSSMDTYNENEEMSRDSVVGGAMETIADDACQVDERTGRIVTVESHEEGLSEFLQEFLDSNVEISNRIWTWTLEIIKHGDFKLRRREYYLRSKRDGVKSVFYEDVVNPYKVTRIEYMGKVLGYRDEDNDESVATFEKPEEFVHFMSTKNSHKEKVKLAVRNEDGQLEDVICYKVQGTSLMDNARYIFRIVNLLDNMLVLSRVARSTQYNLVKVEVGNSSPAKTQQILSDVRRRLEGTTRLQKNTGIKSDPSPIPINTNVYIPTREGKGDITIEGVASDADVRGITDLDYFKDKEFAALRVPKSYLGFGEDVNSLANNSLLRIDARYGRTVQRVQTILINGIMELCNNYLAYRGRKSDFGKFTIKMRPLDTVDSMSRVEELATSMQALDSMNGMLETYGTYIDKAKLFNSTLSLMGLSAQDIGSEEFLKILKEIEDGTYKEENHKEPEPAEDEGGGGW